MARLTDKQRKLIVADYIELQSYNRVAKKYGISATTVKKWVLEDTETVNKCEEKKQENLQSVLDYLETLNEDKKKLLGLFITTSKEKLENPSDIKYKSISVKDNMIGYGTLLDKELKIREVKLEESNPTDEINENILSLSELINNPRENRKLPEVEEVEDDE